MKKIINFYNSHTNIQSFATSIMKISNVLDDWWVELFYDKFHHGRWACEQEISNSQDSSDIQPLKCIYIGGCGLNYQEILMKFIKHIILDFNI